MGMYDQNTTGAPTPDPLVSRRNAADHNAMMINLLLGKGPPQFMPYANFDQRFAGEAGQANAQNDRLLYNYPNRLGTSSEMLGPLINHGFDRRPVGR